MKATYKCTIAKLILINLLVCSLLWVCVRPQPVQAYFTTSYTDQGQTFNQAIKRLVNADATYETIDHTITNIIWTQPVLKDEEIDEAYVVAAQYDISGSAHPELHARLNGTTVELYVYGGNRLTGNGSICLLFTGDCSYMFSGLAALESCDFFHYARFEHVTNTSHMFDGDSTLYEIDVTDLNITDQHIFIGDYAEPVLGMFGICENDITTWSAELDYIEDASYMFRGCANLARIDFTSQYLDNPPEDPDNDQNYYHSPPTRSSLGSLINADGMFEGCENLTSIDLRPFSTSNIQTADNMFKGCSALDSLDMSCLNFDSITSANDMFEECNSLQTILSPTSISDADINLPDITDAAWYLDNNQDNIADSSTAYTCMIKNITNESHAYVRDDKIGFVVPTIISTLVDGATFNDAMKTLSGGLANIKHVKYTTNPTIMSAGTYEIISTSGPEIRMCFKTDTIYYYSLEHVDKIQCPRASYMFANLTNCVDIDVIHIDFSTAISMERMFSECTKIMTIDFTNFSTESCTNMSYMFYRCMNMRTLDLSSFTSANVVNSHYMFMQNNELRSLTFGPEFTLEKSYSTQFMFYQCWCLSALDLSCWTVNKSTDMTCMFDGCGALANLNISNFHTSQVLSMANMFNGCPFTSLDLGDNFTTTNCTSTQGMFNNCTKLTSIDLSTMDFANVTSTAGMFNGCAKLNTITTSNWGMAKNQRFNDMFNSCTSLENIDLSTMQTSSATTMNSMFKHCAAITTLNLNNFNTSNVTDMGYMFFGCKNLTSLDVTSFNTSRVTNMAYMFAGPKDSVTNERMNGVAVTSLNLANFNTSNVTNMAYMFAGCRSILNLDLSNFNTQNVTNFAGMFTNCNALQTLTFGDGFNTSKATNFSGIFASCSGLTSLDLSTFTIVTECTATDFFTGATNLKLIKAPKNISAEAEIVLPVGEELAWYLDDDENDISDSRVTYAAFITPAADIAHIYKRNDLDGFELCTLETYLKSGSAFNVTVKKMLADPSALDSITAQSRCASPRYIQWDTTPFTSSVQLQESGRPVYAKIERDAAGYHFLRLYTDAEKIYFAPDSSNMFRGWSHLRDLSFLSDTRIDTSLVTNMSSMFEYNNALTSAVFPAHIDVSNVTNMSYMFKDTTQLTRVDTSYWQTSSLTNINGMFELNPVIQTLDLNHWDTAQLITMNYAFDRCSKLATLNIDQWHTPRLTSIVRAFYACSKLTSLDLSNWAPEQSVQINSAFCDAGIQYLNLSSWNNKLKQATNENGPFQNTWLHEVKMPRSSYTYQFATKYYIDDDEDHIADTSTAYTTSITGAAHTYIRCRVTSFNSNGGSEVASIGTRVSTDVIIPPPADPIKEGYWFDAWYKDAECTELYDWTQPVPASQTLYAGWLDATTTLLPGSEFNYAIKHLVNNELTQASALHTRDEFITDICWVSEPFSSETELQADGNPIYARLNGSVVELYTKAVTVYLNQDSANLCDSLSNASRLSFIEDHRINTSHVTGMSNMFGTCTALTALNIGHFDTACVNNMDSMFQFCQTLTTLDLHSFNTANVTTMRNMFYHCESLASLDISNFDTSRVTDMGYMFDTCESLASLNIDIDTSNVRDMNYIFAHCKALTALDISSFNTSNVTNMSGICFNCNALTAVTLGEHFNTANVTSMDYMFAYCNRLSAIDVGKFNTQNVTNMSHMFVSCTALSTLDVSEFNTSKVTNISNMFNGCRSLTALDVSSWDTSAIINMSQVFSSCALTTINLSHWNTSNVTNMQGMFNGCSKLTSLDLSNFDTSHVTNMDYLASSCRVLYEIYLPNDITAISDHMFYGCNNLSIIHGGQNITAIADQAFAFFSPLLKPLYTFFTDYKLLTAPCWGEYDWQGSYRSVQVLEVSVPAVLNLNVTQDLTIDMTKYLQPTNNPLKITNDITLTNIADDNITTTYTVFKELTSDLVDLYQIRDTQDNITFASGTWQNNRITNSFDLHLPELDKYGPVGEYTGNFTLYW